MLELVSRFFLLVMQVGLLVHQNSANHCPPVENEAGALSTKVS